MSINGHQRIFMCRIASWRIWKDVSVWCAVARINKGKNIFNLLMFGVHWKVIFTLLKFEWPFSGHQALKWRFVNTDL